MAISNEQLLAMHHGSSLWNAERRRCEQFLTGAERRFLAAVRGARFAEADAAYTDMLQTMDELMQLAGVEK